MANRLLRKLTATLGALACLAAIPAQNVRGAEIVVVNGNLGELGFNDPTPATPVGGNTGTTVGQQRLIAFQHAADLWGALLESRSRSASRDLRPLTATRAREFRRGRSHAMVMDFSGRRWRHLYPGPGQSDRRNRLVPRQRRHRRAVQLRDRVDGCLGEPLVLRPGQRPGDGTDLVSVSSTSSPRPGFITLVDDSLRREFNAPPTSSRPSSGTPHGQHWNEMTDDERSASSVNSGASSGPDLRTTAVPRRCRASRPHRDVASGSRRRLRDRTASFAAI